MCACSRSSLTWQLCSMPAAVVSSAGRLETHLQASLAIAALKMALDARHPRHSSLVHHSDRGVQYACGDYTDLLRAHGIVASMSRIGNPYDNAKVESFMKTLKQEEIDGKSYRNLRHATQNIGSFIEQVYNRHRLHSALDYRSPLEFEVGHAPPTVTVAAAMGFQGMGNLPR